MDAQHIATSRFLSYILRHAPESIGITLDDQGWVAITTLIDAANAHGHALDEVLIQTVVAGNDKQRFAISADGLRIRAVQGHSTPTVAITRPLRTPPTTLYHGTATRFLAAILAEGLRPGQRQHVHLSADPSVARSVGERYGHPVILRIDAQALHAQGHPFWCAENGVWLTPHVPPKYLQQV